ncbi:macrophage mannose receptor 1 [Aphelenchoides avenae]|nr:macrophage mannose receptor 1 [Aphelenchus avenae]
MRALSASLFWLTVYVFVLDLCRSAWICRDGGWQLKEYNCSDSSPIASCWKCYRFNHEPRTWYEARTHCAQDGGRMAKLESEEENAYVIAAMWSTPKSVVDPDIVDDVWIGLYTPRRNCDFLWTDGTPYGDFHPWDADEPSKCYARQGRYCAKIHGYYGTWVAGSCTVPLPSVCEKDPVEQGVSSGE